MLEWELASAELGRELRTGELRPELGARAVVGAVLGRERGRERGWVLARELARAQRRVLEWELATGELGRERGQESGQMLALSTVPGAGMGIGTSACLNGS